MSAHGIIALKTAAAAALSTVAGVTGKVKPQAAPKSGDAWLQWAGAERTDEGGGYAQSFTHTYRVIVVLPADGLAAEEFIDARMAGIVAALADILAVGAIEFGRLPAEGSQTAYNALIVIGETE